MQSSLSQQTTFRHACVESILWKHRTSPRAILQFWKPLLEAETSKTQSIEVIIAKGASGFETRQKEMLKHADK